jgi:Kef-type K+ transport system membrane component KefB
VLFGTSLLAIGTAARLDLSTLTACFFMGLATGALSRHRHDLRTMVAPTERPVLLPALLLAGARLDFRTTPLLPWIAAAAIGARVVAKVLIGWLIALVAPPARRAGPLGGVALLSSGALAMSIGLAFALRFPGVVGGTVLVVAALSAMLGEILAPAALRRMLRAAGEIEDVAAPPSAAAKGKAAA